MRFIIGFLITLGLLIFVFVLILRGGNGANDAGKTGVKMLDYANSNSVVMQFTEEGPVEADQSHNQIRITVGSTQSNIEVFQGYEQNLIRSKTYPNNSAAYADFLRALELSGYNNGNKDKAVADERGYCAAGRRYVFGIKDNTKDIQRLWSSTCGTGSYKGKTVLTRDLFYKQIPDFQAQAGSVF